MSNVIVAQSKIEIVSPGSNGVVIPDNYDFATQQFSDPWDMSNMEDAGLFNQNFTNVSIRNGLWSGTTINNSGHFWIQWGGYPGSYPNGREGLINKINADFYKRFVVKMYSSSSGKGRLWWFWNQNMKEKSWLNISINKGWNIYCLDLPQSWNGKITGMRLDPITKANTKVVIDWIRLTPIENKTTDIVWDYKSSLPEDLLNIFLDNNLWGLNRTQVASINYPDQKNIFHLNTALIYPGIHYAYIRPDSDLNYSSYSGPIKKNQSPIFKITNPDKAGGEDWSRKYLRNSWDFNRSSDIASTRNISGKWINKGVFSGRNTTNDPMIIMRTNGKIINTNKYRFLTVRYKYDGAFDLRRGTMARFIWQSVYRDWNTSDDIVTYDGGWRTYTVDLKKIRLNGGVRGWRGWVKAFRFDPNEDPKSRRFYIDYIKLTAEDKVSSYFDIKYQNYDPDDLFDNLRLYWDTDRIFGNGNEHLIIQKPIANGVGVYRWRPSRSLKRRVWIYARVNDSVNTKGYYSSGTLRVHK